ncbi:DUF4129 domain-containing protein [uncultured Mycobacterium sp.]|uniref:DUF4129 domain-containing protein n=1 Tax=uncultured Mycobacterium sp. TaxID=171292 RepID=UPI0035CA8E47
MPAIDIDRDAAHQAAQRELAKPIYPKESPIQRLHDWLDDLVYRVLHAGASMPGGWFTVSVLLILLAVGVGVAIHVARRTMRTRRGDHPMFDGGQLSAAQHRATAEELAAGGDWAAAIRHRLRAVASTLEDSGVISPMAGRTANELARDAGARLPHLASEMSQAAIAFNDVTYGGRPGTPAAYRMIADLDDHLGSRSGAQVR